VPQLRSPFVSAVFVLLPLFFIFPKVVIFVWVTCIDGPVHWRHVRGTYA
jgi:hypothetical protein